MFTGWFRKQADRWFAEVITEEAWHLRVLAGANPAERQHTAIALRLFVRNVIEEVMEEVVEDARAAEIQRRKEEPCT